MPLSPFMRGLESVLERADVRLDGRRAWDLEVRDQRLFGRVMAQGTLGFGEAYMDGWWECGRIDECISRLMTSRVQEHLPLNVRQLFKGLGSLVRNMQSRMRALTVARIHYDLGNDFFQAMLDPLMQYSCGYFQDTQDLEVAQQRKLDLIRRKLDLQPTDRLLDIGCGWGGLARFMAEHAGCHVTGVNISHRQIEHARAVSEGFPVEIHETDYRGIEGEYDKIVSVGMFEHVGPRNYRMFMRQAYRHMRDRGLLLLHTIGAKRPGHIGDAWLNAYIFPNGQLPAASQILHAAEGMFVLEDWHNFGTHYDRTLLAWHRNFEAAWPKFKDRFGERFYRMWRYYLLSCAGAFRSREIQLWQIVLSKNPSEGYVSVR